jgi:hypothetical protein
MPTVFGRRYDRPINALSKAEQAVGAGILVLLAAVIGALVYQVATDRSRLFSVDEPTAASPPSFPDPGCADWRAPARTERFTPDNLFVKIDGRAEFYREHHVVALIYGVYTHDSDASRTIDVYHYEFATPADAQAAYEAERPPQAGRAAVGDEGYQVSGAVFFRQGTRYVQVLPGQSDDADASTALHIAQRIAEHSATLPHD